MLDKTCLPVGKVPFSNSLVPGNAAFKLGRGEERRKKKKVWIIAQSHWPHWGGFLSLLKNRPRTKPDGSRLLALFNALPPTDGSPFALLPPPLFQASTTGPFCSVAGNNLLLPSCSEVTFCPWLDSTRLYHRIAFELAVAFLCSLIRCQGEQCEALQNFSPAQASCGMAGGREEHRCIKQPCGPWLIIWKHFL